MADEKIARSHCNQCGCETKHHVVAVRQQQGSQTIEEDFGDYIPKSQFDRSFGLELEGPKECLAGLLERRSRHINLFPQFFAIRLVGPLGKAHCGGFLYRVGGSLLTALHGRSVSLFCSQGHSPREPGTPCGHYSILPGEDTFLQVYGRLGIHEGVVPAEPARKNPIPHLLDRFRDSVLGSKG